MWRSGAAMARDSTVAGWVLMYTCWRALVGGDGEQLRQSTSTPLEVRTPRVSPLNPALTLNPAVNGADEYEDNDVSTNGWAL